MAKIDEKFKTMSPSTLKALGEFDKRMANTISPKAKKTVKKTKKKGSK